MTLVPKKWLPLTEQIVLRPANQAFLETCLHDYFQWAEGHRVLNDEETMSILSLDIGFWMTAQSIGKHYGFRTVASSFFILDK